MGNIIKYCNTEHRIDNSDFILLGSLKRFRSIETIDLRDEREATFDLSIHIESPTKFSNQWISTILNGTMDFGARIPPPRNLDYSCFSEYLNIIESSADGVILEGVINFRYSLNNCLIFCMSDEQGSIANYASSWGFSSDYANAFSQVMAYEICNELRIGDVDIERSGSLRLSHGSNISIYQLHGPVQYKKKDIRVRCEADLPIELFFFLISECRFHKDIKFSKENEYRFTFDVFINNMQTFTNDRPIRIRTSAFLENIPIFTEDKLKTAD